MSDFPDAAYSPPSSAGQLPTCGSSSGRRFELAWAISPNFQAVRRKTRACLCTSGFLDAQPEFLECAWLKCRRNGPNRQDPCGRQEIMTPHNSSVKMSPFRQAQGRLYGKGEVTSNAREQQRTKALNQVESGGLTGEEAAELMGLSLRQIRRLLAGYRKEGIAALAHGNRGRSPVHRLPEDTRKRVVAFAQGAYSGLNRHYLQELLAEREELVVSRSPVWRILTGAGMASPRRRRRTPRTATAGSAIPRRGCCSR